MRHCNHRRTHHRAGQFAQARSNRHNSTYNESLTVDAKPSSATRQLHATGNQHKCRPRLPRVVDGTRDSPRRSFKQSAAIRWRARHAHVPGKDPLSRAGTNERPVILKLSVALPVSFRAVSRPLELSLQSSLQLSLTVLVRYRSHGSI